MYSISNCMISVGALLNACILYVIYKDYRMYTKESFDSKKIFRMFYASWCKYSQQSLPIFKELMNDPNLKTIQFEIVDIDKNPQLTKKFNVKTYPTFILSTIYGNKIYEGPRKISQFKDFLLKND